MKTDTHRRRTTFIHQAVEADLASGRYDGVVTRFPPEPNGYLHIGHAKAFCISSDMVRTFGGHTNLRMDDTNPLTEEQEYIDAAVEDIAWLGLEWKNLCYASDYFGQLYEWATVLVGRGLAYVDDQSADQVRDSRGTLTRPGRESPWRGRSPAENLNLLERMKCGESPDGSRVLRARIDMAHPNLLMRDPVMYRILHAEHPRTGGTWCVYPMYDWAHGQSDWIEGVTHSLCDVDFENHRPLYDWFLDRLAEAGVRPPGVRHRPRQIEFARGNITYLPLSKRWLIPLVERGIVTGWDDPRMPTLRGMRRRGFPPESIRRFWREAGVTKRPNNIHIAKLESVARQDLNRKAVRRMAVLDPLRVVVTDYPEGRTEYMTCSNNPEDESAGVRQVPFGRVVYIERADFMEDPPRGFHRLAPGREVRLRSAYWVRCEEAVRDGQGNVVELRCTHDPDTRDGKSPPDGRKVKSTLHWVSAAHAVDAEVRLYDRLFTAEDPRAAPTVGGDWLDNANPASLRVLRGCKLEPCLLQAKDGDLIQFERIGYFTPDPAGSAAGPVFNRTVGLRDTWARLQARS